MPLRFFGGAGIVLMIAATGLAWPLFVTYVETGLVPRFPTAILAMGKLGSREMTASSDLDLIWYSVLAALVSRAKRR